MRGEMRYIADDGREFKSLKKCWAYEKDMRTIIARVNKHKNNPSEALIALMDCIQNILSIEVYFYNGYRDLFANHKPCAFACSLWRVLSDYASDYPTIYLLYSEYMEKYVALYGEPKKL